MTWTGGMHKIQICTKFQQIHIILYIHIFSILPYIEWSVSNITNPALSAFLESLRIDRCYRFQKGLGRPAFWPFSYKSVTWCFCSSCLPWSVVIEGFFNFEFSRNETPVKLLFPLLGWQSNKKIHNTYFLLFLIFVETFYLWLLEGKEKKIY